MPNPPFPYLTTIVPAWKTVAEVQKILASAGAKKIMVEYEGESPVRINFELLLNGFTQLFRLDCQYKKLFAFLAKHKIKANEVKALNISWRVLKDYLKTSIIRVQCETAEMAEIFTPYLLLKEGKTLYEKLQTENFKLLS